ncbi:hypothetical protein [Rhizobium leguminosarum]|uniref:hypothetical protein n=1 Tax=Rhizobium leguminosarum TaxID=384 RepID=UPI002E12F665|nr:hypothetical protein U8Q02_39535 [Rhizobium leguminosarum]
METYCLINAGAMPRWSILTTHRDELVWMNLKGQTTPFADGRVMGHISGNGFENARKSIPEGLAKLEQDYAYRFLLDPYSNQGWIAPDGKFYGCKYWTHDDIAYALLMKSPLALEYGGWVRVHDDSFRRPEIAEITKRQESVLVKLGFEPWEFTPRTKYEIDRSSPPPRYAVTAPDDLVLPGDFDEEMDAADVGLTHLVERMREHDILAALLDKDHELIDDVGPGTWDWMIQWDGLSIGGEETVDDLLRAEGLHLSRTSFDTIEVSSWPYPGLHSSSSAEERMIEREIGDHARLAPAA